MNSKIDSNRPWCCEVVLITKANEWNFRQVAATPKGKVNRISCLQIVCLSTLMFLWATAAVRFQFVFHVAPSATWICWFGTFVVWEWPHVLFVGCVLLRFFLLLLDLFLVPLFVSTLVILAEAQLNFIYICIYTVQVREYWVRQRRRERCIYIYLDLMRSKSMNSTHIKCKQAYQQQQQKNNKIIILKERLGRPSWKFTFAATATTAMPATRTHAETRKKQNEEMPKTSAHIHTQDTKPHK